MKFTFIKKLFFIGFVIYTIYDLFFFIAELNLNQKLAKIYIKRIDRSGFVNTLKY